MSNIITMPNGVTVDLHTKEGSYEYVATFLIRHGADGTTCGALAMLAPPKECGYCGHDHADSDCTYSYEPGYADYIASKPNETLCNAQAESED